MEKKLEAVMNEISSNSGVSGCVFADHQGLCLGSKGKANTSSAGLIVAIAELAGRLEPNQRSPVILLENDTHSCFIQRNGTVTGAMFKHVSY